MSDRSEYTHSRETWFEVSHDCPECGGFVGSNGRIHDCKECEWWTVIDE